MLAKHLTLIIIGLVLTLTVPGRAQDTGSLPNAVVDSSSIVTLEEETTYSRDTLAMVYLHRLYARKPPGSGDRTQFTGKFSSAANDTTAQTRKKWKKWKKDEVAQIAGIKDLQFRERRAETYLSSAARKKERSRKRIGGIMLAGSVVSAGVALWFYQLDQEQAEEGPYITYEPMSLQSALWPSGVMFALTIIQFNLKGKEERAYKSYQKEKGIDPKVGLSVLPGIYGGTEVRLNVSIPIH